MENLSLYSIEDMRIGDTGNPEYFEGIFARK